MISYAKAVTTLLALAMASLQSNEASAKCHSYYYQKGTSDYDYVAYSWDHDTSSCSLVTRDSRQKLASNDWTSVFADKNHQSTIQVTWYWVSNAYTTIDMDLNLKYYLCDGITQASMCSGTDVYESECYQHYIFEPVEYTGGHPRVCLAETDSDGNLMYDSDGEPYGICDSCVIQDHNADPCQP